MYIDGEFQLVKVWTMGQAKNGDIFTFSDESLEVVKNYYNGLAERDKEYVVGIYTSIAVKDKKGNIYSVWKDDDTLDVPDTYEGLPGYMGGEVYL